MPFCMRGDWSRMRKLGVARKRDEISKWGGIYNLAWWTTVTSHHQINLCKYPYVSPRVSFDAPFSPLVLQMQHELCTHADRSWAQKQTNPRLCWLTEQAHVLQRRWNRNAQKEKKHTAVSGLFSFGILHSLSLYARMKIIPSKHLRCRITSAAPPVQPDIRSPLRVWSHRWRRLWSWKLAPNSHKQRQLSAGQINMWPGRHTACSDRSLPPLTVQLVVFIRCLCLKALHRLTVPQWYLMLFNINESRMTW